MTKTHMAEVGIGQTEHPRTLRVLAWPARRKRVDNPYSWLVQASTAPYGIETSEFAPNPLLRSRWDVIHIHWPDILLLRGGAIRQLITGALLLAVLRVHRRLGARLVWTVHNVMPHEVRHPTVARRFMTSFASITDGVISPSAAGLELATAAYPCLADIPQRIVPIGTYASEYPAPPSRAEARAALHLATDAKVFLAFGQIRGYKNLPHLVRVFRSIDDPTAVLIIAGPNKDAAEVNDIELAAAGDERIRVMAERIDDNDVPTMFTAADHFVAPFTSIVNSSSVLLALTYGCRAVVPAVGGIPEVAATVGPGWVQLYDGEFTAEHLLTSHASPMPDDPPDLDSFGWDRLGRETADFFLLVVDPSMSDAPPSRPEPTR